MRLGHEFRPEAVLLVVVVGSMVTIGAPRPRSMGIGAARGQMCPLHRGISAGIEQPTDLVLLSEVRGDVVGAAIAVAVLALFKTASHANQVRLVAAAFQRFDQRLHLVGSDRDDLGDDVAPLSNCLIGDHLADELHRLFQGPRKVEFFAHTKSQKHGDGIDHHVTMRVFRLAQRGLPCGQITHDDDCRRYLFGRLGSLVKCGRDKTTEVDRHDLDFEFFRRLRLS